MDFHITTTIVKSIVHIFDSSAEADRGSQVHQGIVPCQKTKRPLARPFTNSPMMERNAYSPPPSCTGALPAVVLRGTSSSEQIAMKPVNEIAAAMPKVTAKACVRSGMMVA